MIPISNYHTPLKFIPISTPISITIYGNIYVQGSHRHMNQTIFFICSKFIYLFTNFNNVVVKCCYQAL